MFMNTKTRIHFNPSALGANDQGFSVTETLIAMAIFAVGFAAVASIFPVGAVLQQNTADDVLAQQVADNARALITGRKFRHEILTDTDSVAGYPDALPENLQVQPVLQTKSDGSALDPAGQLKHSSGPGDPHIWEHWQLNDRSYFFVRESVGYHPQHTLELGNPDATEFNRSYYWVPLIRRTKIPTSAPDWQVFVFVLRGGTPAHAAHGYDRHGITSDLTDGSWANFDGFFDADGDGPIDGKWLVPGVHRIPVTVTGNRFDFTGWNNNRYGIESSQSTTSTDQYEVKVGDQVLDNNGTIHTVESADNMGITVKGLIPQQLDSDGITLLPNFLWYGRPAAEGSASPTKLIIAIGDAVE